MKGTTERGVRKALDEFLVRAGALRLRRLVALDGNPKNAAAFAKAAAKDDRFLWLVWPHHRKPDLKFFKQAARMDALKRLAAVCCLETDFACVGLEYAHDISLLFPVQTEKGEGVMQPPLQKQIGARIGFCMMIFFHNSYLIITTISTRL